MGWVTTRTTLRRWAAVGLALAALAGACSDDDAAEAPTTPAGATSTTADPDGGRVPTVNLLEAGAEPRRQLRLALVEGTVIRASLTVKFGLQLESQGKPLPATPIPPVRVDLGARVDKVSENGNATVGFGFERIDVVDDGSAPPDVVEQVRRSGIDRLTALRGATTITRRGVPVEHSLQVPEDLPRNLEQVVDQLSQQTASLTVPFPAEAVGPGARWRATSDLETGTIATRLVLSYVLRQAEGDRYVLDVAYEQTAPRQKAELPNLPAGTEVEIRDFLVSGKGEVNGTLASVFPSRSTLAATGTINMDVRSRTERGTLVQRLSLDVTFDTLPPA